MRVLLCAAGAIALLALPVAGCGGDDDSSAESTAGSTASETTAAATEACDIDGRQRDLGASYVTSLEVTGVECPEAEQVIVAYHACRLKDGPEGKCTTAVEGYTCTESDVQAAPGIQYNATANCENAGGATIVSAYTQNL